MHVPPNTKLPTALERRATTTVLPLTTVFTPPASCLNAPFTLESSSSGVAGFSTAWRDWGETSSQCYPHSFSSLQFTWGWYSPGVCPSGYAIAQTSIPSTAIKTTQAWCCPAGYTITGWRSRTDVYQACTSMASDAAVVAVNAGLTQTITPSFGFVAMQWPISVEWASSDLSLFQSASAPLLGVDATTTTTAVAGTASGTANTGPSHDLNTSSSTSIDANIAKSGLSTGAIVGIAIGLSLGILVLVACIFVYIARRRRSLQRVPTDPPNGELLISRGTGTELPNAHGQATEQNYPVELDELKQIQELDIHGAVLEKGEDRDRIDEM
jgi:hypothetical protein